MESNSRGFKSLFRSESVRVRKGSRGGSGRRSDTQYGFKVPVEFEKDLYFIGSNIKFHTKKMNELQPKIQKKKAKERSKRLKKCEEDYEENYKGLKENARKLYELLPLENSRDVEEERRLNQWKMENLEEGKNKLQREVDDMRMRLNQEVEAKEDAIRRLSELASSKLRDNNPNIADLSDQNRPTKLAEQISELYDNEWTEAFDEMEKTGRSDEEIVQLLRDSFMEIYKVCKRVNEGYLHRVQKVVDQFDSISGHDLSQNNTNKSDGSVDLPDQFRQQIKEVRKLRAKKNMDKIVEGVMSQDSLEYLQKSPFSGSTTQIYVRKCIQVCWLMCVQDPPLHLSTDTQEKFNLDVFREYTKRGSYVAYVVWPVLYLHLDGPILCKGVAQGTSEKPSGGRNSTSKTSNI